MSNKQKCEGGRAYLLEYTLTGYSDAMAFLSIVLSKKVKCNIICCCEFLKNIIENMAEKEEFKVTY